jgi:hypothetical protein
MTDILYVLVLLVATLLVFGALFAFGYRTSADRTKSMENIETRNNKSPFSHGSLSYDWKLTVERDESPR